MNILVDSRYCKGCKICIAVCKNNVLSVSKVRSDRGYLMPYAERPENCINCRLCERNCPDLCINIEQFIE